MSFDQNEFNRAVVEDLCALRDKQTSLSGGIGAVLILLALIMILEAVSLARLW